LPEHTSVSGGFQPITEAAPFKFKAIGNANITLGCNGNIDNTSERSYATTYLQVNGR